MRHEEEREIMQTTGCLIAPNVVLTCAYNLYDINYREEISEINYYPAPNGLPFDNNAYKAKRIDYKK